ncbi:MAG: serine hydrolase, partial [bacterium]|nr:serine hydrolase [bacterium]
GIDEQQPYAPASLAKVPLLIAYLKMAEGDSDILTQRVTFTTRYPDAPTQEIVPTERLTLGRSYTITELLRAMIVFSDNDAAFLLQSAAPPETLTATYSDLHIPPPDFHNPDDTMTVETYARFFRFLYNGTYVNEELSEYALSLLAESTFDRGIVAGVPSATPAAHKFGERTRADAPTGTPAVQLHDCGIVYHPERPYIFCAMSRGYQRDDLTTTIAAISRAVYDTVVQTMEDEDRNP